MNKTLICKYNGEILGYGTVKTIEEFISVEIPNKYPDLMDPKEFVQWLAQNPCWTIAK